MTPEALVAPVTHQGSLEQLEADFLSGTDVHSWLAELDAPLLDLQLAAKGDEPRQWLTSRRTRPNGYCCR